MKLRKGDGPKAIVLSVLILATCWFIYHTLAQASTRRPVAAHASTRGTGKPGAVQAQGQGTRPLFAARPQVSAGLLKIASTPDPFQPAVADQPAGAARREPSVLKPATTPPLPGPERGRAPGRTAATRELPDLRLAGIMMNPSPLAVLQEGEYRQLVHRGDLLAGGWRVTSITRRDVSLEKDGRHVTLRLGEEEEKQPRGPLPVLRPSR